MIACPCCDGLESRLVGLGGDRLFRTTEDKFALYECRGCGVIFLWPSPAEQELSNYYPRGYWWQTASPARRGFWHRLLEKYRRWMISSQVRRAKRSVAGLRERRPRLLDIGCGDGLFLSGCEPLPWLRLGFDQCLDALRATRQRGGVGVALGYGHGLPFADQSIDLITMFHVLEHLPRPHQHLKEVRRVLAPGGCFLVQVPNAASLQRHLLGRRWAGFDVPRHLVNYSTSSLQALLDSNGFEVVHIRHFSMRDNPAIPVMSLFPRLYPPARRLMNSSLTRPWVNGVADLTYFFLVLLATPLALVESLGRRGGTILVEARKRG
jgi:SAM-dependent methyltransferase